MAVTVKKVDYEEIVGDAKYSELFWTYNIKK